MPLQGAEGKSGNVRAVVALIAVVAVGAMLIAAPADAAEPNNDFATATGPINAGKTFKASLEEATDVDFQFFYVPDTATLTVTTINATTKRGGAADRGRTIVSSILRARKGKFPQVIADTSRTLKPKDQAKVKVTLLPGKYFIPIGRQQNNAEPLPDVPFRIRITPIGATTDSYEIFESRCAAAKRRLDRNKSSIKRTLKRIKKAKKNDAPTGKIVKLKLKLKDKRAKAKPLKKAEKFACSIPR
jgi:hypothetical protein